MSRDQGEEEVVGANNIIIPAVKYRYFAPSKNSSDGAVLRVWDAEHKNSVILCIVKLLLVCNFYQWTNLTCYLLDKRPGMMKRGLICISRVEEVRMLILCRRSLLSEQLLHALMCQWWNETLVWWLQWFQWVNNWYRGPALACWGHCTQ